MAGVFTMVSDGSVHSIRLLLAGGVVVLLAGESDVSEAVLHDASVVISAVPALRHLTFWPSTPALLGHHAQLNGSLHRNV